MGYKKNFKKASREFHDSLKRASRELLESCERAFRECNITQKRAREEEVLRIVASGDKALGGASFNREAF